MIYRNIILIFIFSGCISDQVKADEFPPLEVQKFYSYFYPKSVKGVSLSNVFSDDKTLKKYNLDEFINRKNAVFDATQLSLDSKHISLNDQIPINSYLLHQIFSPQFFLNPGLVTIYHQDALPILEEIRNISESLTPSEQFILARDLHMVLSDLMNGARMYNREPYLDQFATLSRLRTEIEETLLKFLPSKNSKFYLKAPLTIAEIEKAILSDDIKKMIGSVAEFPSFQEATFNASWSHLNATSGSSMFRIWTWNEMMPTNWNGAMIVRYAVLPYSNKSRSSLRSTKLIEEISISSNKLGELDEAKPFPTFAKLVLNRNSFVAEPKVNGVPENGYLFRLDLDKPTFIGFRGDIPGGPPRGSDILASLEISCIECHGIGGENVSLNLNHREDHYGVNVGGISLEYDEKNLSLERRFLPFFIKE